jgi:hypothetical protein
MPLVVWWLSLPPLETVSPMVYPDQGNGFAAYILGGFGGLAVLVGFMVWISKKPKRRQ